MSAVIIDRRKNDKGKSTVNRQKFLRRVKESLKDSVRDLVGQGSIKDLAEGDRKKVVIPDDSSISEPWFHGDGSGSHDIVVPGNDQYVVGDKIKRRQQGAGKGKQASADGEGLDEFTFHLTREEFLDLFFENCELPDLVKETLAVITEEINQRSGFTTDGPPSMVNIMRSMRGAKARRSGLRAIKNKKLKDLEDKVEDLRVEITARQASGQDVSIEQDALKRLLHDIEVLKRRIKSVPFIDPTDLRYNNWIKVPLPKVQAVMLCLMDVSGSMDEERKELAKTFYLLLYLFLARHYESVEIAFIQYHSVAKEVDEQEFFYGHESGGTVTSAGVQKVLEVINERYSPATWNIYVAHASDGDNFSSDNLIVDDLLRNQLLPLVQYYAYVQIQPHSAYNYGGVTLMDVFKPLHEQTSKVGVSVVGQAPDVYPALIKLFEKKP